MTRRLWGGGLLLLGLAGWWLWRTPETSAPAPLLATPAARAQK